MNKMKEGLTKIAFDVCGQREGEIVEAVDRDLRKMLIKGDAKEAQVVGVRVWPKAIPQFTIGHLDTLDAARAALAHSGLDGLFLGGNYVSGVALGRCVEGAYDLASQVAAFQQTRAHF